MIHKTLMNRFSPKNLIRYQHQHPIFTKRTKKIEFDISSSLILYALSRVLFNIFWLDMLTSNLDS